MKIKFKANSSLWKQHIRSGFHYTDKWIILRKVHRIKNRMVKTDEE